MAFLDRFSYKNPKLLRAGDEERDAHGGAGALLKRVCMWGSMYFACFRLLSPLLASRTKRWLTPHHSSSPPKQKQQKQATAAAASKLPVVNSAEFLSLRSQELGPDQLFFHRFFREKAERDRRLGRGKGATQRREEEDDGGSSDAEVRGQFECGSGFGVVGGEEWS